MNGFQVSATVMRGKRIQIWWHLVGICVGLSTSVHAQGLKHEFRGAWIATVINLDWPSEAGFNTSEQKSELVSMMDQLAESGINAIIFQIRSESDAMYASAIEPWSRHLTGIQGAAPFPYYDPLEYAIELAHERGMELHAWFNPFRVNRNLSGGDPVDPSHVSVQHPEWVLEINNLAVLNPGLPDARDYVVDVVLDVVERYDIDGVHFDDYFYPYPPNGIGSHDLDTWDAYNPGNLNLGDWRRDNINQLVRTVSEGIVGVNPDVKFGISPSGIWKDGVPTGISGNSAYDAVYADAVKWMEEGWVDYIAPQLYWKFGGPQDFELLAFWWSTVSSGRHIYPGLAAFKADPAMWGGTPYVATEIPRQIRYSREASGIQGNVLFRAENILKYSSHGLSDSLQNDLYKNLAITPSMSWREGFPTGPPRELSTLFYTKNGMGLVWSPPDTGFGSARRYAVYRQRSPFEPLPRDLTNDPANLLAITYRTSLNDAPPIHPEPYWYVVTALNANSIESDESNMIMVTVTGLATETLTAVPFRLNSPAPNPFRVRTSIDYELDEPGVLRVQAFDVIGRRVTTIVNRYENMGPATLVWDGNNDEGEPLPSGIYFITLHLGDRMPTKAVVLVR